MYSLPGNHCNSSLGNLHQWICCNTIIEIHVTLHLSTSKFFQVGNAKHPMGKAGSTVRFEITVRYEICWAKSTVRNYGTIHFPRYGTVQKYDIFFVLFSNLFRTNLIIERKPGRYVRKQDLYHFCRVSMKSVIVQKKKRRPNLSPPFPATVSFIGASYRRPSRLAFLFLEGAKAFLVGLSPQEPPSPGFLNIGIGLAQTPPKAAKAPVILFCFFLC